MSAELPAAAKAPLDFKLLSERPADFLLGILDVLVHVGLAMRHAGLISADELAGAMDLVVSSIDHQSERLGVPTHAPGTRARKLPALALRETFAMPFPGERKFSVVAGGNAEPPGAA